MAQEPVNKKGVTLIIVVFAMMLFGVLGWTLARMQATDFESNLRTFEPDNALNLAEAGAQYALNILSQNSCTRTVAGALNLSGCSSNNSNRDMDCADLTNADWLTTPHSLSPGQYNLCLRDPCTTCTPAESGDVVIVSRGYIPSQSGSRTMRQVKLEVDIGSLTNALQTQVPSDTDPQQGLFDWSQVITDITPQPHTIQVDGNIKAGHYNGDGDAAYDEAGLGQDYKSQPPPILPDDRQNPESETRTFTATYPAIDMAYFYALAPNSRRWPNPDNRQITFTPNPPLTTLTVGGGGSWIRINISNFFNNSDDTDGVAIRRTDTANWWTGVPGVNWTAITNVSNGPGWSRADISSSVSWPNNTPIKLVKYFNNSPASGVWYIGKQIAGGEAADTLIDLQGSNIDFDNTYLITEADTVIKGANRIRMYFTGSPPIRYPELATQNGNIISLDLPAGANENNRRDQRRFQGLIYSQNGLVTFDYLRGAMVYGNKVTFNGTIRVDYSSGNISSNGFVFEPATRRWKEE